ncbi:MAG: hypothetical protein NZ736_05920 [Candidatus Poseidoniaceae archaeon]|nr:hypothetical protein [Candidatus Poseidoniaceae archaeon]
MSFDLELAPTPKRRNGRNSEESETPTELVHDDSVAVGCPGCGSNISDEEWVDSLVGFISGATDFEVGNPVRARIVQTLKNEASRMNVPHPTESWELAIVSRLMKEIERIVQAEINRYHSEHNDSEQISSTQRQEIEKSTEERVRSDMALEIRDQVIMEIAPILEAQLRQEIEQQLWTEFENEWKQRSATGP